MAGLWLAGRYVGQLKVYVEHGVNGSLGASQYLDVEDRAVEVVCHWYKCVDMAISE